MKKLLTLSTLVFSLMVFPSTSFADWKWVGDNTDGSFFYVDFERIRKVDGYVYFWILSNYMEPSPGGNLSTISYHQGDCEIFRVKYLSFSSHKELMGKGVKSSSNVNEEWVYPKPNSMFKGVLKSVCEQAH